MCCRFTSLIDPYIACIAVCLKDESVQIRRQTLTQLTDLLTVLIHVHNFFHFSVWHRNNT